MLHRFSLKKIIGKYGEGNFEWLEYGIKFKNVFII